MKKAHHFIATRRHWATVFALVTLLIIVTGLVYYQSEFNHIRQDKYHELAAIAELKAGQILHWRQEQLADARRLASSPLMRKAVADWLRDPSAPGLQADLQERFKIDQEVGTYADVLLLDPQGHTLLSLLPDPDPLDPVARRALEEAIASGEAVLSDFYRCPKGHAHLDAVAPILDSQGRPLAAVVLQSNADDYLYPLIQSWPPPAAAPKRSWCASRAGMSSI